MNDGMNFWMDSFALLKKSKNVVNAHKFLYFIMRPDVSAKITSEYQYSSPNAAARKLLPENGREMTLVVAPQKCYMPDFITDQYRPWGRCSDNDVASLRVFMATLRKKLEPEKNGVQYIQTHIGIGYRMLRIEK